jgi:hypothetical protein
MAVDACLGGVVGVRLVGAATLGGVGGVRGVGGARLVVVAS